MAGAVGLREVRYTGIDNHFETRQNGEVNPRYIAKDETNPYFGYDPAKCIVCSRCVRACEEVQWTFALTIEGRGFESRVSPGAAADDFLTSDCVSCGACVQACPTATLQEKSVIDLGTPTRSVVTTCAYCGVGCSFNAELNGDTLVRMVPAKQGKPNRGHSCVKGRFAWGYAQHRDRVLNPMIRERVDEPWREVSWERGWASPRNACAPSRTTTAAARSASSLRRAAPTRRPSWCRNSPARCSSTTTPTPAPGSAIRPPATGSAKPSVPRPARRISIRSSTPTWPS